MRLIDADKLLEKTECLFKDLNSTEDYMGIGYNHGVGDSMAIIKNAPTIEAEPVKHGRWEPVTNGRGGFECSICHSYASSYQDGVEWLSPYCPNCGAKMDLEGEPHEHN